MRNIDFCIILISENIFVQKYEKYAKIRVLPLTPWQFFLTLLIIALKDWKDKLLLKSGNSSRVFGEKGNFRGYWH